MGRKSRKNVWSVWTSELMREMMEEAGLFPDDFVKGGEFKKFRFQSAHCYGKFTCGECKNIWTSEWSWIKFDMQRQRVSCTWEQKCTCPEAKPVRPIIFRENFEYAFGIVIDRFFDDKPKDPKGPRSEKPNHRSDLCAKCDYGNGKPCNGSKIKK